MSTNVNSLYICPDCSRKDVVNNYLIKKGNDLVCNQCHKIIPVVDNIPVFAPDVYWGKASEESLISAINIIDQNGWPTTGSELEKKFDFTFKPDSADWRVLLPLNENSTVLDIGAGLGRITIPLAKVAKEVVSCDQSLSRMRFLRRRAEAEGLSTVTTFVGDVFNLPLKPQTFDVIVMNGVLEWVGLDCSFPDPREAQLESLRVCFRLLKDGGHLYIGIENRLALVYLRAADHGGLLYTSYMPRFLADGYSRLRGRGPYRTYTYSKKGYDRLFQESGFKKPAQFYLVYPGYNLPRIAIQYDDLRSLLYVIVIFMKSRRLVHICLRTLFKMPGMLRFYRFFFYSFGIILKK